METNNNLRKLKIKSIKITENQDVFDLTTTKNHNFFANGILVHNCGEQMLAPGGICCLSSLNLTQFINEDCTDFDYKKIAKYTGYLVRFLDNVNTLSNAPLPEYEYSMKNKRRIGIGILGWASSLFMLKIKFGSDKSHELREKVMSTIARSAYMSSIDLAEEKGMFKLCDPQKHSENPFIQSLGLSKSYMEKLKTVGIRNSSLLSIQPTGNTSILANVVSSGLEPIFMPEYIRTVIVPSIPEDMIEETPKWYDGEWHETKIFKFTKEGDEEILKGKHNGIVYKIDKNRGLTKEVTCSDYGVRYLKEKNEWNPKAPWAVTALNGLTVEDHVNDLVGFARWVDSAMSKTVNVPHEYPFDDFKNVYLDVYKSGYVKGVTTYRTGTMTAVLSSKETDKNGYDEEIILDDVILPETAEASMKTLRAEGRKWYLTVVWNETRTRPFALFVHTNHHEKNVITLDAIDKLTELAKRKNIKQEHIDKVLEKIKSNDNASKIARMISLNLRHGVLIKNIVATLDSIKDVYVGSFIFQIKKFLASFIKDGEIVEGAKCTECGSEKVVYQEGCHKCMQCGSSKCG
jgi:ribonucleoside-diphosphate reductase alpha chain